MDRVQTLIQKLQEQANNGAAANDMLITVQLLHKELAGDQKIEIRGGIIAMHPVAVPEIKNVEPIIEKPAEPAIATQLSFEPQVKEEKIMEVLHVDEDEIEKELDEIKKKAENMNNMSGHVNPILLFDPVEDVPTLAHQVAPEAPAETPKPYETEENKVSLNERLKEARTELSEKLVDTPIKDLKKAIGINDRYLFINELFRGDEAMYERSIKTINGFSIFPEAEYWIRRELKLKLGWSNEDAVVQQFDQLIRRRFS